MTNVPDKVRARVANGIRMLDAYGPPDWRKKINLDRLHIALPTHCVLGQVYGHYEDGLRELEYGSGIILWNVEAFGFYAPQSLFGLGDAYDMLDAAWQEALAA